MLAWHYLLPSLCKRIYTELVEVERSRACPVPESSSGQDLIRGSEVVEKEQMDSRLHGNDNP